MASANAAQVGDTFVSAVSRTTFPARNPFQYVIQNIVKTPNGIILGTPFSESGVDVHAAGRHANPKRSIMLEDHLHISRFAKDAHVRQHAMVHQLVRAHAVPTVFA